MDARRRELAAFLTTRRERLTPADVGIPDVGRRRVRGLRREEVAQLAAISTTWYTWLEQARDVTISAQVAESISRALRLDEAEQRHLFALLGMVPPTSPATAPSSLLSVLERVVNSVSSSPAYIVDARWDILGWNGAASALFGIHRAAVDQRNLFRFLFLDVGAGWTDTRMTDPATMVPVLVGQFRSDFVDVLDDDELEDLLRDIRKSKAWFNDLWAKHDVASVPYAPMRYDHPGVGRMEFSFLTLELAGQPSLRVHMFIAADDDTGAKLEQLRRLEDEDGALLPPTLEAGISFV